MTSSFDAPTQGHLVSDVLDQAARGAYAQDSAAQSDPAPKPIPVLVSHLATALLAVILTGVNTSVWALVPGGLPYVLSVVSLLVQAGVTAGLAWWAHQRSRPVVA